MGQEGSLRPGSGVGGLRTEKAGFLSRRSSLKIAGCLQEAGTRDSSVSLSFTLASPAQISNPTSSPQRPLLASSLGPRNAAC